MAQMKAIQHEEIAQSNASLREEIAESSASLRGVIAHNNVNQIQWMFFLWIGQIGVLIGILFAFFK